MGTANTTARFLPWTRFLVLVSALLVATAGLAHADEPEPREVRLEGQLVDDSTGETVPDVTVELVPDEAPERTARPTTGPDGGFNATLPAGEVSLRIQDEEHMDVRASLPLEANASLRVPMIEANDDPVPVSIQLQDAASGDAVPRVTVDVEPDLNERCDEMTCRSDTPPGFQERKVDLTTEDGSRHEVHVTWRDDADRYHTVETDADGTASLSTPPGAYLVKPIVYDDYLDDPVPIQVQQGANNTFTANLTPIAEPTVEITGTVSSSEGPVDHASVEVLNQRWGTTETVFTDEQGNYSMQVRDGYVEIAVYADEHLPYRTSQPVEPGEQVRLDVTLTPSTSSRTSLQARLVDTRTGDPVANASVLAEHQRTGDYQRATTDADGSFELSLAAGPYRFVATAEGYYRLTETIDVHEGQPNRFTFELTEGQPRIDATKPHPTIQETEPGQAIWTTVPGLAAGLATAVLGGAAALFVDRRA